MLSVDEIEIKATFLFYGKLKLTYSENWHIWLMFHIEANFNVQSDIVFSEKRRPRIHEKPFSQVKPVSQVKFI